VLARLRQEIAAGRPLREALRETLLGTGRAVVLTSIVLLGGFGVLVTSEFQSVVYLGGLVSLTVFLALFADLFLLPALLHLLQPDLGPAAATPPVSAEATSRAA
jgi:predicted RND superfamily exporter protein